MGMSPDPVGRLGNSHLLDIPLSSENGISAEFGTNIQAMAIAEKTFIETQAEERVSRAQLSGHRVMRQVFPGDLVYYWRNMVPKKDRTTGYNKGRYLGPARVIATESRPSDGEVIARNVVWLARGARLIKVTSQQLRPASTRELSVEELRNPTPIPWTLTSLTQGIKDFTYEDAVDEAPSDADHQQGANRQLQDDKMPPLRRFRHKASLQHRDKRQRAAIPDPKDAPDPLPPPSLPATSSIAPGMDLGEGRPAAGPGQGNRRASRSPRRNSGHDRELLAEAIQSDHWINLVEATEDHNKLWEDPQFKVEASFEIPRGKSEFRECTRDMKAFLVKLTKRSQVEIHEGKLTKAEREEFGKAKDVEVNNYLAAKVFAKLPKHLRPSRDQILKMRWVLTWKWDQDGSRKAKARCVILGYMDPDYENRPTASPTMSRTTRQLFLQMCANLKQTAFKGDVSGAFLQGREFSRDVFIQPTPEIAKALELEPGEVARLTKAAYGLVEAPLEWYLTVSDYLQEIGYRRLLSDPCCWIYWDPSGNVISVVCGHVDDFLFSGNEDCPIWSSLKKQIQERFRWGQWETNSLVHCGVLVEQHPNREFSLSQIDYVNNISEIPISRDRARHRDAETTEHEKSQLKGVLGSLGWHTTQLSFSLAAEVSWQQSNNKYSTVSDLLAVNKLVQKAKLQSAQKIRIHSLRKDNQGVLVCWEDAAWANRPDGSSTKGILIGFADPGILNGELSAVSPIFWQSAKIDRKCRSAGCAETRACVDAEDELMACRFQWAEMLGHSINLRDIDATAKGVPGLLVTDSRNVYDKLQSTMLTLKGAEKRADLEALCLKEAINECGVQIRWVNGESQLANSLTKSIEPNNLNCILRWDFDGRLCTTQR